MFNTQILAGSSGQGGETQQSLKFNDDESQYLSWTPAAAGNRKTWTWSGWVKRGNIGINSFIFGCGSSGTNFAFIGFSSDNTIDIRDYQGSYTYSSKTSQVFRDTSAFYHLVLVADMNNATSADRIKLYVNGERVTSFNSAPSPTTKDLVTNSAIQHVIGSGYYNDGSGVNNYLDGYLSDVYFIDGQALDASSFGQFTNGYWEAKDYAGTYGTNGFHLTFQDDVVSEGFNTVTYRGTGATQSVSGLGLEADLVWIKQRSSVEWHRLHDTVRGVSQQLYSNGTNAEATTTNNLLSVDSDGFTLGTDSAVNGSGFTYVGWCWDAGSGSPVSNTDGSITSTVKANPSYGFSIVSYTGTGANATVGHGLSSAAPELIIVKNRSDGTKGWPTQVTALGNNYLELNTTNATFSGSTYFNNTAPTSSVFSVGTVGSTNASGNNLIAYCFHSVAGYSSIGSYSGTGSDNTVSGLGFRPAFVMTKRTDGVGYWTMMDNTRNPTGELKNRLWANASDAESVASTANYVETTSDGFTVIGGGGDTNASGGTYIYMAFADTREAAFWKDVSGQGNHWQPNNLDYRDSLIDSPANNFATLNPLFTNGGSTQNFKEGNLQFTADGNYALAHGTFAMRTGKWYWETYIKSWVSVPAVGISRGTNTGGNSYVGYDPNGNVKSFGYESGGIIYGASGIGTSAGSQLASGQTTYTTGDVIGCSFDADVGELKFYKNGTLIYTVSSIDEFDWMPATSAYNGGINIVNFGQDSTFSGARPAGGNTDANNIGDFAYAPPSGYLALCTANLPEPTIVDGSEHFNTVLYTGTGATQSITGVGFGSAPDFVWIKDRTTAYDHHLFDVVRGGGNSLYSNDTVAENTYATDITFDADGFTVANGSGIPQIYINKSGDSYAAWNWKAGGTAVSNTDGSITSQVSANVDAGFSIVSYTGSTSESVGHGLGQAPECIFVKDRDAASSWAVYHQGVQDVTANGFLELNSTFAVQTGSNPRFLSGTAGTSQPTSTVFYVNNYSGSSTNNTGNDYIAYCFHSVDGFSKVGSYTGNGSSDGVFVFTGGRVQWLMIKRADSTGNWYMWDDKRHPGNDVDNVLYADLSNAESVGSSYGVDFLSNGFKVRHSGTDINASGGTFIYLAILESPLKFATAR